MSGATVAKQATYDSGHVSVKPECTSNPSHLSPCCLGAEHALLKSYNLNREAGVIKLLALLLPRDGKVPEDPEDLPSSST